VRESQTPLLQAQESRFISGLGLGCVKTLFKSKFAANLRDFRKLQFAKALISLKPNFGGLGFNHNLIRSLTFSHSLGQSEKSENPRTKSAVHLLADMFSEIVDIAV
jgi:hypothetical protein